MEIANHFKSLEDLIGALEREQKLLKNMFYNRKSLSMSYDIARELAKKKDESLQYLRKYGVIRIEADFVEMEDVYLKFFEDVLVVNENINVASVKQYIDSLSESIEYFLSEKSAQRKQRYLNDTKRMLRNIALSVLRNVIDLKRNIDSTYKNEPTFSIKKKKLEKLDEKRHDISVLINEVERLIDDRHAYFFILAMDEYLQQIVTDVKYQLHEAYHNLIELDRQIINYLNLIEYQDRIIRKIQRLKHLRDQLILETHTDIKMILAAKNPVWMEPRPRYPLKPSLPMLRNSDDGLRALRDFSQRGSAKLHRKALLAEPLQPDDLAERARHMTITDISQIKDAFLATGDNLFHFVMNYTNSARTLLEEDRLVIFCQIASQYISELTITPQYNTYRNIQYPIIYPKR